MLMINKLRSLNVLGQGTILKLEKFVDDQIRYRMKT